MERYRALLVVCILLLGPMLTLSGCARPNVQSYLRPGLRLEAIRSLALLPFDNISGEPDAGMKVMNLFLTELVRTEELRIADLGEVELLLRRLRVRTARELDREKLRELADQLKVQAVLVGSVDEYTVRQDRRGALPIVSINARLLDARTGQILWAASHTHDGDDWETVFGFGRVVSLSQLAQIVISEMVDSLMEGLARSSEAP